MTISDWREVELGDVVEFLDYKRRPLNSTERASRPGPYPYYGASGPIDSVDGYLFDGRYLLVAEDGENLNSRKLPVAFFATGKFWVNNHAHIIRGLPGLADDEFLKHWFEGANISGYITGAAQPKLSQANMKRIQLFLPSYANQRRIASILSAYDDLIENNTRRIAILEEMARRVYEEWFVHFRFPGHEGVRMVESELGLVPEGWHAAALGDIAAYINRGLAPKYDDAAACIVINQKCIRDQRLNLSEARKQGKPVPPEKVVRLGDVLINSTGVGTLGRVAQVLEAIDNCTVDTHVSIVRPGKDCEPDFFGLTLLARQAHFEAQGVGSTGQTELSRGRIAETPVVVPPLAVQQAFGKLVQPMRRLTVTLQNKNLNLRTTRDLLLPKLISGELDVSATPAPEALAA